MEKKGCCLCALGRRENLYAKEFVEYYRKLGFKKIFIYDNNYDGEEHFEDVLQEDINDGFVEIVDWRNKVCALIAAYEDFYENNNKDYDWLAIYDFDEYLIIPEGETIDTFMERYNGFDCLCLNWMIMTDNNLTHYDNRPLMERFTEPMKYDQCCTYNFPENRHVKSIIRGGLGKLKFPHAHIPSTPVKCCNAQGKPIKQSPWQDIDFSVAYLKHFATKTIEEFLTNKAAKGNADLNYNYFKNKEASYFYKRNKRTPEKDKIIDKILNGK